MLDRNEIIRDDLQLMLVNSKELEASRPRVDHAQ